MYIAQSSCSNDDEGYPICKNRRTRYEVLEGIPRLVIESCQDCSLEMDEIGFEELEEENERLKDEKEDV